MSIADQIAEVLRLATESAASPFPRRSAVLANRALYRMLLADETDHLMCTDLCREVGNVIAVLEVGLSSPVTEACSLNSGAAAGLLRRIANSS